MSEHVSELRPYGRPGILGLRTGQLVLHRRASDPQNPRLIQVHQVMEIKGVTHVFPTLEGMRGAIQAGGNTIRVIDLGPKSPVRLEEGAEQAYIMLALGPADNEAVVGDIGDEEFAPPPLPILDMDVASATDLDDRSEAVVAVLRVQRLRPVIESKAPLEIQAVVVADLTTQMILAEDVTAIDGTLLVGKGQEVTELLRERLKNFARGSTIEEPIRVFVQARRPFRPHPRSRRHTTGTHTDSR